MGGASSKVEWIARNNQFQSDTPFFSSPPYTTFEYGSPRSGHTRNRSPICDPNTALGVRTRSLCPKPAVCGVFARPEDPPGAGRSDPLPADPGRFISDQLVNLTIPDSRDTAPARPERGGTPHPWP